jgi:cyclophilin family peptidyl-prolyl cis-trans isomerase
MITFRTTMGDFSIELDFDKAPVTAANFLLLKTKRTTDSPTR